jgi:outer membrane lipoprotein carrier protein
MSKNTRISFTLISLLLLFFIVPAPAEAAAYGSSRTQRDERRDSAFETIKALQKDIHALSATIHQEKKHAILKDTIYVKGKIFLEKPGLLRWEASAPERSITVVDGTMLTVYYPDMKEAEQYKLSEHFLARNTMGFLSSVMWGSLEELEKQFSLNINGTSGKIVFMLRPLSGIVQRYLSSVRIIYDRRTGLPLSFEVVTPRGDRTLTILTDVKVNPVLEKELFHIRLPKDVLITNNLTPLDTR